MIGRSTKIHVTDTFGSAVVAVETIPHESFQGPVVVCAHGLASSKESRTYMALEEEILARGLAVVRIDLYGHGESDGDFFDLTISKAVASIQAVLDEVKKRYTAVGLVGSSFGGVCSLVVAAHRPDITALVLMSPVVHYQQLENEKKRSEGIQLWKDTGFLSIPSDTGEKELGFEFYEDAGKYDGYDLGKKIHIPTCILHGDQDDVVPIEHSKKLLPFLDHGVFVTINGGDHRFTLESSFLERCDKAVAFLAQHLTSHST